MFLKVNFIRRREKGISASSLVELNRLDCFEFKRFINALCTYEDKKKEEIFKILDDKYFFTIEKGENAFKTRFWKTKAKNAFNLCIKNISYGQ